MKRFTSPQEAQTWCSAQRVNGRTLGLVPTMGALHDGHLQLVRRAAAENDAACVSIFVNPLQFDDPKDLEAYPRDFEADTQLLQEAGASMAFTGTLDSFFPGRLEEGPNGPRLPAAEWIDPGPAAQGLEGSFRTGHFEGVATIVNRLFEVASPQRAYFGQKDYQQCLVVTDVARRRGEPKIVVCPTVREPSGLARSSRNERLAPDERARAARIHAALQAARAAWSQGERGADALADCLAAELAREPSLEVEYAEVRDPEAWSAERPQGSLAQAHALIAARLGEVRLIDNLSLSEPELRGSEA